MISFLDLPSEGAPRGVATGALVDAHAYHADKVQGAVSVSVAAPVQTMAHHLAGGGFHR